MGPESTWQRGPSFLLTDYKSWPRTNTEEGELRSCELPQEECRALFSSNPMPRNQESENPAESVLREVGTGSKLGEAIENMAACALTREKLEVTTRALARALGAILSGNRESCQRPPSVKLVQMTVRVLLRAASRSAVKALREGKIRGLGAQDRGGTVWVT